MFLRFGLPQVIMTDNGTCFISYKFKEFARLIHICYLTIVPYNPSSTVELRPGQHINNLLANYNRSIN